jgi:heterodisulfide reductase subunit A
MELLINGMTVQVTAGATLLQACEQHGIPIPTLCHHKGLPDYGACRLCLVEIEQAGRSMIQASCTFPVLEGLAVRTDTERVKRARRIMAELLLARCPESEVVRRMALQLGVGKARIKPKGDDCILCGLCVRVCRTRMGRGVLGFARRGSKRAVHPAFEVQSPLCQTCGACYRICPTRAIKFEELTRNKPIPLPSEFDEGLIERTAVYKPYPQAVPNCPVIDGQHCVYIQTGACQMCKDLCEAGAIDFEQKEQRLGFNVGAVVLAAGFEEYKPTGEYGYGYGRYKNVVTSLEFERILSASGPYEGHVKRPSDLKQPKKVAWIQCVGSRNAEHYYCSSVCCMYATKEAVIAREHCGGNLDCHVYYMDMRCFGKDFEKYYERAKNEYGIQFRRCKVSALARVEDGEDLTISYEDESGVLKEETYDMVVVSTALAANPRVVEMAKRIGVATDEQGFVKTDRFEPMLTDRPGVYACGALTEPKDIPETVTEATGAAAAVSSLLAPARNTLVRKKEYPPFRDVSGEEPRIGVFICNCGINIGGVVKVPSVVEYARTLPGVVYADENLFTCSQDTQQKIRKAIDDNKLNRVIVASCTPRTHEPLFQETLAEAGLNPYLFTMANIRDQCSWVHMQEPLEATEKSKELVRMAVANSRLLKPLQSYPQAITQKALVVGGGLAGMTAAMAIGDQGFETYLVERQDRLGGNLLRLRYTENGDDIGGYLARLEERLRRHPNVKVATGAELIEVTGYVGNYKTRLATKDGVSEVEHGVFVVATGADEYRPKEFLYGQDERVKTQTELETMLAENPDAARDLKYVVMVQCVGSREPEHPWCSRICCTEAVKNALKLKQLNPKADVYVLYRDMRTYGFKEALYRDARAAGVMFVRFDPETKPEVLSVDGKLHVSVYDPVLQRRLGINADMLVLSAGVVPPKSNHELGQLLKVPLNEDGFFLEAHMKLRPVDFTTRGVFMAGMAHSPRRIPETVAQAYAAAARACSIISHKELSTEAVVAEVNPRWCRGCGMCEEVCQYEAARLNPETGKSEVTAVLCQGCGACAAACPSEAIKLKSFEAKNVLSMVDAAL